MQLLDWLRDGLLSRKSRYRHTSDAPLSATVREFYDPSGRHDFRRRAHHPDPNGHYQFGEDPTGRMITPHKR